MELIYIQIMVRSLICVQLNDYEFHSKEDLRSASFDTTWLKLSNTFGRQIGNQPNNKDITIYFYSSKFLFWVSFLAFYNVLCICECPGHPYLQSLLTL